MDAKLLQQLIRSIQETVRCPVCSNRYPQSFIRFKGNLNNFYLFNLKCPICQSNVFAQVLVNGNQGLKPKADIFVEPELRQEQQDQAEAKKKTKLPTIKADEVIAFAKFIESNKKPFSQWLV